MNATNLTTSSGSQRRPGLRRLATAACIGSTALLLAGCDTFRGWIGGGGGDDQQVQAQPVSPDANAEPRYQPFPPTTQPAPQTTMTPVPQTLQPVNRPIVTGQLPQDGFIVYLVEGDGPIRVANIDSGEEIATFDAKAGQIVRVNPRGVTLANQPVIGATLAPGTYGIYKVPPDGAGSVRSTQGRTVATPEAASRPAITAPPPGFETLTPQSPPGEAPPASQPTPTQ